MPVYVEEAPAPRADGRIVYVYLIGKVLDELYAVSDAIGLDRKHIEPWFGRMLGCEIDPESPPLPPLPRNEPASIAGCRQPIVNGCREQEK